HPRGVRGAPAERRADDHRARASGRGDGPSRGRRRARCDRSRRGMTKPAVRPMRIDDAQAVATLATQLGYPSNEAQLAERIPRLLGLGDAAAMVAEDAGAVVAWIHVELRRTLVADHEAQVMALVVDERCRGRGIG